MQEEAMISSMRDTRVPGIGMMKLFNRRLSVKRVHAIEQQIKTILHTAIHLTYDPQFPLSEGNSFRLFQVVYTIGPDTKKHIRQQIIHAIPLLVNVLFAHQIDCYADTIALRVRAHTPTSRPTWPHMFFEIFWDRKEFKKFRKRKDVTIWYDYTRSCINHFDSNDPLHKEIRYINHL
jgi:hypothetical protein